MMNDETRMSLPMWINDSSRTTKSKWAVSPVYPEGGHICERRELRVGGRMKNECRRDPEEAWH